MRATNTPPSTKRLPFDRHTLTSTALNPTSLFYICRSNGFSTPPPPHLSEDSTEKLEEVREMIELHSPPHNATTALWDEHHYYFQTMLWWLAYMLTLCPTIYIGMLTQDETRSLLLEPTQYCSERIRRFSEYSSTFQGEMWAAVLLQRMVERDVHSWLTTITQSNNFLTQSQALYTILFARPYNTDACLEPQKNTHEKAITVAMSDYTKFRLRTPHLPCYFVSYSMSFVYGLVLISSLVCAIMSPLFLQGLLLRNFPDFTQERIIEPFLRAFAIFPSMIWFTLFLLIMSPFALVFYLFDTYDVGYSIERITREDPRHPDSNLIPYARKILERKRGDTPWYLRKSLPFLILFAKFAPTNAYAECTAVVSYGLSMFVFAMLTYLFGLFAYCFTTIYMAEMAKMESRPIPTNIKFVAEAIPAHIPSHRETEPTHWIWKYVILCNILYRFCEAILSTNFAQRILRKAANLSEKPRNSKKFEDAFDMAASAASLFVAEADWNFVSSLDMNEDPPTSCFFDRFVLDPLDFEPSTGSNFFQSLVDTSISRIGLTYIVGAFSAPKYSTDKTSCIANHCSLLSSLLSGLGTINPRIASDLLRIMRELSGDGPSMVAEDGFSQDWIGEFASGLDCLSAYKQTPINSMLRHFLTFLTLLPIPLSGNFDPVMYRNYYEVTSNYLAKFGASVSSVLRSIICVQSHITAQEACGSSSLLKSLFFPDNTSLKHIECERKLRLLVLGDEEIASISSDDLVHEFRRNVKATTKAASRTDASPYAKNCANRANEMLEHVTLELKRRTRRPVPFVVSFDGNPGTGKTEFMSSCVLPLLHKWRGIEDVMQISSVSITDKYDNTSSNATTAIL